MLTKDRLWKAILEDFFPYAILFYFPEFHPKIDWKKGFVMLDKELLELFPESEQNERRADLLAKVWLLDGSVQWILIHVEVQGYKDPNFPDRMFTYFYRIKDRFNVPISALAILTDINKSWRPDRYMATCMGTEIVYKYPLFKLIDYKNEDFDGNKNPWAVVMKAALIGLKGKWTDDALFTAKVQIYKELRENGYAIKQVRDLLQFLKYHVHFQKKEYFLKFETEIKKIDKIKKQPMGIQELVKEHIIEEAKKEGIEQGIEQGEKRAAIKKDIIHVRRMLQKGLDDLAIIDLLGVEKNFVKKIKQYLTKEEKIISQLKNDPTPKIEQMAKKFKVPNLFVEVLQDSLK